MADFYPDVNAETTFFTPGAEESNIVMLKEYTRYLVRSRIGRIKDILSVNSVLRYATMIISIICRTCNHEPAVQSKLQTEFRNFVTNDLVHQEGLSSHMHPSTVAHSEDLTFIVVKLYTPAYLNMSMTYVFLSHGLPAHFLADDARIVLL
ncbi:hypothetical protein BS50DRAFT_10620 [Corynespora cassiicola Philippines]|uniref:Uncharacterized protein n=1 Tax=Corynespora cassiicola Philippines TaxID=1448308 RepID=A0A2T2P988_CORCC|nr:hypothetical protein BS50DRAFT_10620 [Corynespora cassiicola Philippines]